MRRLEVAFYVDTKGCWVCTSHKFIEGKEAKHYDCKVKGKVDRLHRHMYRMCYGEIPKGGVIRHDCNNPRCINPGHLLLGTHADNVKVRVRRGRSAIGERHGRAKLTKADVRAIRADITTPKKELARYYDVDPKVIYNVQNYYSWKHVE